MNRPSKDNYFMDIALVVAKRSTCLKRAVGAVLVDYNDHILSTGYNGYPVGFDNCIETGLCVRSDSESGEGLDKCIVVHAEQNALLQCSDVNKIKKIYTTTFPCIHCIKLLMNTSCKEIIYRDLYSSMKELSNMWCRTGKRSTWCYT